MNNIQKIRYAIYNNPLLIGTLLKDTSIKKGIIYSEMKKALPCKIGIEFELSGDFHRGFIKKYHKGSIKKIKEENKTYECVVSNFIEDLSTPMDTPFILNTGDKLQLEKLMQNFYGIFSIKIDDYRNDDQLCEVRICLKDFHQLKGLYLMMQDMSEFCKLHEGGGIHIHTDMTTFNYTDSKRDEIKNYISNHLDDVEKIFPKYTGKYNKRKVGFCEKGTWVNMSRLHTLEFRIAPLTFDYIVLIQWIRGVIKFRNQVIHYCKLKSNYNRKNSNLDTIKSATSSVYEYDGDTVIRDVSRAVDNYSTYTYTYSDNSTINYTNSTGSSWR